MPDSDSATTLKTHGWLSPLRVLRHTVLLCLFVTATIPGPHDLVADTLKEVKESAAMRSVVRGTRKGRSSNGKESYFTKGMEEGSNFASIWASGKSPSVLLNWISANIPKYYTSSSVAHRKQEFAEARITISNTTRSSVVLTIMVPHPTYRTMVEHRILAEFNKFEPPMLPVVHEETLPLNGIEGKLYQTTNNQCSIVVKAAHSTLVNLDVRDCGDKHLLVAVAKALDFQRLNRKLNS